MATEQTTLRIKAENLGTVNDVKNFLADIEYAYNCIYTFDFLVETLSHERERRFKQDDDRFYRLRKYSKELSFRKDYPFDPFFYEIFIDELYRNRRETLPNLIELQTKIDIEKIVLPSDQLIISKVNIQSPGFWEFFGSLNPLQQIREYLKDRHERKKDRKFRDGQEQKKGELDILERENNVIKQRIEILKSIGYSDTEIRPVLTTLVIDPLKKIGNHQDKGLIDYPESNR